MSRCNEAYIESARRFANKRIEEISREVFPSGVMTTCDNAVILRPDGKRTYVRTRGNRKPKQI